MKTPFQREVIFMLFPWWILIDPEPPRLRLNPMRGTLRTLTELPQPAPLAPNLRQRPISGAPYRVFSQGCCRQP